MEIHTIECTNLAQLKEIKYGTDNRTLTAILMINNITLAVSYLHGGYKTQIKKKLFQRILLFLLVYQ